MKEHEASGSKTPDTEEARVVVLGGDDAVPTMLEPYFLNCMDIEIYMSREALDKLEQQAWQNSGRPELFAAFLISNELAIIDKTDDKTDEYVERYFHWWWGIEAHDVPMAHVLLPPAVRASLRDRPVQRAHHGTLPHERQGRRIPPGACDVLELLTGGAAWTRKQSGSATGKMPVPAELSTGLRPPARAWYVIRG